MLSGRVGWMISELGADVPMEETVTVGVDVGMCTEVMVMRIGWAGWNRKRPVRFELLRLWLRSAAG